MKVKVSFRAFFGVVHYREDGKIQLWYGPGNRHSKEPVGKLIFEASNYDEFHAFYSRYCAYRGK